jgi:hypothetical protein
MIGYLANKKVETPRADTQNKTSNNKIKPAKLNQKPEVQTSLNGFKSKTHLKKTKSEKTKKANPQRRPKKIIKPIPIKTDFNTDLKLFFNNESRNNYISCGFPSKLLIKHGFKNKEIVLTKNTLTAKIKKHNLNYSDLTDLPELINNPLMIFRSKKFETTKLVILERKNHEGLLCVAVRTDAKIDRQEVIQINSIHGRNDIQLNLWKKDGLLIFEDKKKAVGLVSDSGLNCPQSNKSNSSGVKVEKVSNKSKKDPNTKKLVKKKKLTSPSIDGLQKRPPVHMPKGEGTTLLSNWQPNTHIKPLRSDLGAFMGGYERNRYAMVIRGEKGAGKSRLLMQALNLFAWEDLKCLFLSLEMSPESELFGEYLKYIEGKAKNNVAISANDSIDQLEEYCKKYDVIAVDSWGKLQNSDQWLLDKLMKKYPHVIWLLIFQSTTAGTARGGLGSEYDGSLVIQVAKGGNAQCEKNRYNSTDLVYNVFEQELIQE